MTRTLLAAVVALAPAIAWAQLLPPSPPIQSEPLPPPNMPAPPAQPGVGPVQPAPPIQPTQPTQPWGGGTARPFPPAAPGPGGLSPPSALVPGAPQPPQAPGTTQPFPPTAEPPTAPARAGVPPSGQPPQPSGQPAAGAEPPAAPGQAPDEPEPSAGATPAPPPQNAWVPQGGAIVQVLDKVNATTGILHVKVGGSAAYGSLRIRVLACDIRPPDMPRDAAASLVITDTIADQPGFKGWMLQNEPFLSMLQSPSYDVRVEGCTP